MISRKVIYTIIGVLLAVAFFYGADALGRPFLKIAGGPRSVFEFIVIGGVLGYLGAVAQDRKPGGR